MSRIQAPRVPSPFSYAGEPQGMMTAFDRAVSLRKSAPRVQMAAPSFRRPLLAPGDEDIQEALQLSQQKRFGAIPGAETEVEPPSLLGSLWVEDSAPGWVLNSVGTFVDDQINRGVEGATPFNSDQFVSIIKATRDLTPNQERYIKASKTLAQATGRAREVHAEEARHAVMDQMSFGESLFYGIFIGATDPTSYIPIFGQLSKAKVASQMAGRSMQVLQRGGSAAAAQKALRSGAFQQGFWHTAGEAAIYETAFQTMKYAGAIDKERAGQQFLPSVAMTSAFSGVLGGTLRFATRKGAGLNAEAKSELVSLIEGSNLFKSTDEAAEAVDQIFAMSQGPVDKLRQGASYALGKSQSAAVVAGKATVIGGKASLTAGKASIVAGKGVFKAVKAGSDLTSKVKGGVEEGKLLVSKVKQGVADVLNKPRKAAAASTPADVARSKPVQDMLDKLDRLRKDSDDLDGDDFGGAVAAGDEPPKGPLPSGEASLFQSLKELTQEMGLAKKKGGASGDVRETGLELHRELAAIGEDLKSGAIDLDTAIARLEREFGHIENFKKALGKARERLLEEDGSPIGPSQFFGILKDEMRSNSQGVFAAVKQKLELEAKDKAAADLETGVPSNSRFLEVLSDAKNGMANWIDAWRYGLGRGMASFVADEGKIPFIFPATNKTGVVTSTIHIRKVKIKQTEGENPVVAQWVKKGNKKWIEIDPDLAREKWGEFKETETPMMLDTTLVDNSKNWEGAGIETREILDGIEMIRRGDLAETPEEYLDWAVLHEAAHQLDEEAQDLLEKRVREMAFREGIENKDEVKSIVNNVIEGYNNARVMDWINKMAEGGPKTRKDLAFNRSDGFRPMEGSIELKEGEVPDAAVIANYRAQGLSEKVARRATLWFRLTNPLARAATSTSHMIRRLTQETVGGPIYTEGGTPAGGTVQTRVMFEYEAPVKRVRKESKRLYSAIESEKDVSWEDFSARVHRAGGHGSKDNVSDAYTALVEKSARELNEISGRINDRGVLVGWMKDQEFPDGENWYRRLYDNRKVKGPAFIAMLQGEGVDAKTALEIQKAILSNGQTLTEDFTGPIRDKGALHVRGNVMKHIPYDTLAPYLTRNAFDVNLNAAKVMGGEVELRHALSRVAKDLGAGEVLEHVDSNGKVIDFESEAVKAALAEGKEIDSHVRFNIEPIREFIKGEFSKIKGQGNLVTEFENISLAYERDWGSKSVLAKKYPEDAKMIEQFVKDEGMVQRLTDGQLLKEEKFAEKWLTDMIATIQRTRDLPSDPDSWFGSRLPTLIKNYSHMIMGGKLGIANVADFHRSSAEYGIKHAFGNEWGLLLKDLEAFKKRGKATEEMGFMLEDQSAEIARNQRNYNEHLVGETAFERLSEKGASFMSQINGMSQIANTHQRMFASSAQAFIMDNVPLMLDGTLSAKNVKRLQRMGINKQTAAKLNEVFNAGGVKTTKRGTKYLDLDAFDANSRTDLVAAVHTAVANTQTVPSRAELFDWQARGWGSVLMMYRNWTMAANSRLASAAISNPDMALMSGAIASIGLGAIVTVVRGMVSGEDDYFGDPDEFLRRAIDNGGYLGLVGEANNLTSRVTGGVFDANPIGEGSSRFYDETTALAAIAGPVWHYPNFLIKTFDDTKIDRYDIDRFKGMIPFSQHFAVEAMWNNAGKTRETITGNLGEE